MSEVKEPSLMSSPEKLEVMSETERNTDKEETDHDMNEDRMDDDSDDGQSGSASPTHVGRKSFMGQTCTLKTLVDDEVLRPGESNLHMEYMVSICTSFGPFWPFDTTGSQILGRFDAYRIY